MKRPSVDLKERCFVRTLPSNHGEAKAGKIINFSSSAAIWGDVPPIHIRGEVCHCGNYPRIVPRVCSGTFRLTVLRSIATQWIQKWNLTQDQINAIADESPVKRIGTPEEVAELVAFSLHPNAPYYRPDSPLTAASFCHERRWC